MERRDLLATLGGIGAIGLVGCLKSSSAGTDRSRHVSIVNQDSIADDHELRVNIEVLESTITDAHPATLRISTTNVGPKRAISVRTDSCALFNRGRGGSAEPEGLWLYRVGDKNTDTGDRKEGKWVPDKSPDQPRNYPDYLCTPIEYVPGESVRTKYEVWDDYRVAGYLQPNTYRWEEDITIREDPSTTAGDASKTTIKWGFSLAVEIPD